MTDNRTTELREKLTKCGVEFTTDDFDHLLTTNWWVDEIYAKYLEGTSKSYVDEDDPILKLRIKRVTPEQAISATLGAEPSADATDALELLDEIRSGDRICYDDYSRLFDAIATLGSGTCEFIPTTDNPPTCSNCGWQADAYDCDWLDGGTYEYNGRFCKHCGALIRKAVER